MCQQALGRHRPGDLEPGIHGLFDQVRALRENSKTVRQAIAEFKKVTGDELWGANKWHRDATQYETIFPFDK